MGLLDRYDFTDGRMEFEIKRGEASTLIIFKRYQEGDPAPDQIVIWIPTEDFRAFQELVSDPDKVVVNVCFFDELLAPDMKARDWRYLYDFVGDDNDKVSVHGVCTATGVKVPASALKDLITILEARHNEAANGEDQGDGEDHQGDPSRPQR